MSIRLRIDRAVLLALACVAAVTAARADDSRLVQRVYSVADLVVPIKDYDAPTPPVSAPSPAAKCATQAALTCGMDTAGVRIGIGFGVKCGTQACEQPCPTKAACCAKAAVKCCADAPSCKVTANACDKAAMPACCPNGPCCPDGPCCPKGMAKSEPQATMHDRLIRLVTSTVHPSCWTACGGKCTIEFYPVGLALVVSAPHDIHEQVSELLDGLRRLQDLEVAFEVKVVAVADERYHDCFDAPARTGFDRGAPLFLDDHQAVSLSQAIQGDRRSNVLQAPKLTVFNGQRAAVRCTQEQLFVTGVETMNFGGQTVHVPKNEPISVGFQMSVRPTVSADGKFVRCELKAEHSELATATAPVFPVTNMMTPVFEGGAQGQPIPFTQFIQQPQVVRRGVEKALMIPDGGTAVLYAGKRTKVEECAGTDEECAPVCGLIYAIADLFTTPSHKPTMTEHLVVLVTPRVIAREQTEAAMARPMPCGPCSPVPVQQCATAEVAPRPMPAPPAPPGSPRCGYVMAPTICPPPCPMPAPPMPMAMPTLSLPQVQLDMCVLSLDPAYWDRPDAAAWADLSPKACDGKPTVLDASEGKRFIQSMRAIKVGKLLAEPRLVTHSGRPATFMCGGQHGCMTSVALVERDGQIVPEFDRSKVVPTGYSFNLMPVARAGDIYLECHAEMRAAGTTKEYRVTIEAPGEEPRTETLRPACGYCCERRFSAAVSVGRTVLTHCKDPDGRDLILMVTPHLAMPEPQAVVSPPVAAPFAPPLMPTVWTAPMPSVRAIAEEPPCDAKLMKFMVKYQRACADGDTAKARKFAEKCLAIDPTCFGK